MADVSKTEPLSAAVSCKLWVHDDSFSSRDVLFNLSAFPNAGLAEGTLLMISPTYQSIQGADGVHVPKEDQAVPKGSGFVFIARDCDNEVKTKHSNLQLSVSSKVAKLYSLKNFMEVSVVPADEAAHSATHVELCFRDIYLTRADFQRLVVSSLLNRTLFEGESITFLGAVVRATVKAIFIRGRKVRSAYFANHTKPIFRSESARYVLYIQMSREMWEFDTEGSGEIIFNKVVKSVLPELFRRWTELNARHLVSVVLFTRLDPNSATSATGPDHALSLSLNTLDFYRVVVAEMYSGEWATILYELKKEFKQFLKEVLTHPIVIPDGESVSHSAGIANRLTPAKTGNLLEAINLASSRFARDWIDPDLIRTGLTIIVITPAPGYFHVDETMLRLTNENLVRNGVSIDLLCLSQPPLHRVPLFGFQRSGGSQNQDVTGLPHVRAATTTPRRTVNEPHRDTMNSFQSSFGDQEHNESSTRWTYVIPQWIQIHFWSTSHNIAQQKNKAEHIPSKAHNLKTVSPFIPSARMYEVQMAGIMENQMRDISIPYLHEDKMNIINNARQRNLAKSSNPTRSSFHHSPPKSIYLDSKYGQQNSSKPKTTSTSESFEEQDWMDAYDEAVFADPAPKPAHTMPLPSLSHSPEMTNRLAATRNGWPYSSSSNSPSASPQALLFPQAKNTTKPYFSIPDRTQDKSFQSQPPLSRTVSKESLKSQTRSKNLVHLLPLGQSIKTASKANPTMHQATETVTSSSTFRETADSSDEGAASSAGPVSRQVRSSLLRHASGPKSERMQQTSSNAPPPTSTAMNVPQFTGVGSQLNESDTESTSRTQWNQQMLSNSTSQSGLQQSNEVTQRLDKSLMEERNFILATSPWLTVCNPCRLADSEAGLAAHHGWSHVFVRPNKTFGMKWKSLCSPALLPLASDYTFSSEILSTFEESSYKVTLSDDELIDIPTARERLLSAMVSFRLGKGFQLLPKPSSIFQDDENKQRIHFSEDVFQQDNITLFMSKGNAVHSIHASESEIQVVRYRRQDAVSNANMALEYKPLIKTTFAKSYEPRHLILKPRPDGLNWSAIDNFLAGYPGTLTNSIGFWRARFVLIPIGPPTSARSRLPALAEDSDDEIYIEGIQRLTQFWERSRLNSSDSQNFQSLQQARPKDHTPNPLNLEFQTRDASAVIAAGLDESLFHEDKMPFPPSQLFSETELYTTGKIDLRQVANDLQSEKGIKMHDRRWYFRLHPNCFVGLDLTSWLLHHFQDVESREASIELGQNLMDKGLFKHVSGRHRFRDGNYFYQITSEYRIAKTDIRQGWFSRKPDKGSTPTTPQLDNSVDFGVFNKVSSKAGRAESMNQHSSVGSPAQGGRKIPTVRLSSMIQCDIDIRKKSDRPEIVDLHYDRLYNPDSCYHFRLEWMNTTAKLVEDAILTWTSHVERYGLRLVQIPLVEASKISETNPYRSPYIVDLAVPPPKLAQDTPLEIQSPTMQSTSISGSNQFLRALLRKLGFILESEAASNFPSNVHISHSWGHDVPYQNTQYIHKTGVILAQVASEDKILLVANRLADVRTLHPRDSVRFEKRGKRDEGLTWLGTIKDVRPASSSTQRRSTTASPLATPVLENTPLQTSYNEERYSSLPTAEQVKDDVEAFCRDEELLRALFEEVRSRDVIQSAKSTPIVTAAIPKLDLEPITDLSLRESNETDTEVSEHSGQA